MREQRTGRSLLRASLRGMALAGLTLLAGCAGRAATPAALPADSSSVTVSPDFALPADATALGPVEGVSCARSPFAKASKPEAVRRLKQNAARMGANGVMHMRVATVGISASCWYSYVAEGTAYR